MDLSTLVSEGVARVGVSAFPVTTSLDSNGIGPCRMMLIQRPDDFSSWVVGVWTVDPATATVVPVVIEPVSKIVEVTTRRIHVLTTTGRHVVSVPTRGCACGQSRLRMYNPFGDAVSLASVPTPRADR